MTTVMMNIVIVPVFVINIFLGIIIPAPMSWDVVSAICVPALPPRTIVVISTSLSPTLIRPARAVR